MLKCVKLNKQGRKINWISLEEDPDIRHSAQHNILIIIALFSTNHNSYPYLWISSSLDFRTKVCKM